jgi:hypothetical protein
VRILEHWRRILLGCALVAIVCAGVVFFWPSQSPQAMLACLPPGEGPTLYIDVALLRQTRALEQLAGQSDGEEADYRQFVEATGFDYRRDLDAVLVQWRQGTALFVVKGRFDQERLENYARTNGGLCARSFCSLSGSVPERKISFQPLGRRLMALSAGTDPMGAAAIRERASQPAFPPPSKPVWISLPGSSFHAEPDLPPGLNVLLEALRGAQRAVLTLEIHPGGFELVLTAPCESNAKAKAIAGRLTSATGSLKDLIVRSGRPPEPSSPAAALSAGTFQAEQAVVSGNWPLSHAFFEGLGK